MNMDNVVTFREVPDGAFFENLDDGGYYQKIGSSPIALDMTIDHIIDPDDLVWLCQPPVKMKEIESGNLFKTMDGNIYRKINKEDSLMGYNAHDFMGRTDFIMDEEIRVFPYSEGIAEK